jgi:hypothetical protein
MDLRRIVEELWCDGMVEPLERLVVDAHRRNECSPAEPFTSAGVELAGIKVPASQTLAPEVCLRHATGIRCRSEGLALTEILDLTADVLVVGGGPAGHALTPGTGAVGRRVSAVGDAVFGPRGARPSYDYRSVVVALQREVLPYDKN